MTRRLLASLAAFGSGLVFGAGLVLGGMTDPNKVLGFLDVTGDFNPTLLFVMAGAVSVHALAYRVVRKRQTPWLAPKFVLPTRRDIDWKLIVGSALFGLGWGLAGYCPGPALVSLGSGSSAWVFVLSMALGSYAAARFESWLARPALQAAVRSADSDLTHPPLQGGA
ncbi:MAG TPA: DUF6691 family protein [Polyangiaceae bacterium]|nr:DUF6691 family protein [Polyangiaceae bacterium]